MPPDAPHLHQPAQTNGTPPAPAPPADPLAQVLALLTHQEKLLRLATGLLTNAEKTTPLLSRLTIDAAEVAQVLGVALRSVWTWNSGGLLPSPVRLGGTRVAWNVRELRAWLSAGAPDRENWEQLKAERRQARARKARR